MKNKPHAIPKRRPGARGLSSAWQADHMAKMMAKLRAEIPVDRWSKKRIEAEYTPERIEQLLAAAKGNQFNRRSVPLSIDGVSRLQ